MYTKPHGHRAQALLHSSHLYHEATHNMAKYGVLADNVKIDVSKMMVTILAALVACLCLADYAHLRFAIMRPAARNRRGTAPSSIPLLTYRTKSRRRFRA